MPKKAKPPVSKLEAALSFLSLVRTSDSEQSIYSKIEFNTAKAFNLIVGVGTTVEEDLIACPQTDLFLSAVERAGDEYQITQLSAQKLLIRAGEFHAYIPCRAPSEFVWRDPDVPTGHLDDRFMEALGKVAGLAVKDDERLINCSIFLGNGSVVGTNSAVIVEAWHGLQFPHGLLIPKSTYSLLKKVKKPIVAYGYSDAGDSLTFYFDDDTWLLTKLYRDKWPPSIADHLDRASRSISTHDVPPDFFDAIRKVAPFSADGRIFIEDNLVSSHPFDVKEEGSGLSLQFAGVKHAKRVYAFDNIKQVARLAVRWDEYAQKDGTYFLGDNLRGLIYHNDNSISATIASEDDDIPF